MKPIDSGDIAEPLDCLETATLHIDVERREVRHVISTARLDRGNRVVEPAGWQLANFKRAPRVMADHSYSIEKVIGSGHDLKVEDVPRIGQALVATTRFDDEGLGAVAFRLASTGMVNTWSVGWQGLKSHSIGSQDDCPGCEKAGNVEWGTHYLKQDLLEYSMVAIPANPDAVTGLATAGLVSKAAAEEWNDSVADALRTEPATDVTPKPAEVIVIPKRSVAFDLALNSFVRAESIRVMTAKLRN